MNYKKYSYTYDGNNNRTEEIEQYWDVSAWVNYFKIFYTFDVNNNQIESLWQSWGGFGWVNALRYSYTYDSNNYLNEVIEEFWDGFVWLNSSKILYYSIITDIEEFEGAVNTYSLSNNYPNPFNPTTNISYSIPQTSKVVLKIFDILGNEIETLVDEEISPEKYKVKFNSNNLSSGIYFYQLVAENFNQTRKMILLR